MSLDYTLSDLTLKKKKKLLDKGKMKQTKFLPMNCDTKFLTLIRKIKLLPFYIHLLTDSRVLIIYNSLSYKDMYKWREVDFNVI